MPSSWLKVSGETDGDRTHHAAVMRRRSMLRILDEVRIAGCGRAGIKSSSKGSPGRDGLIDELALCRMQCIHMIDTFFGANS